MEPRSGYSFRNDYSEGAHPQVWKALADTNLERPVSALWPAVDSTHMDTRKMPPKECYGKHRRILRLYKFGVSLAPDKTR